MNTVIKYEVYKKPGNKNVISFYCCYYFSEFYFSYEINTNETLFL